MDPAPIQANAQCAIRHDQKIMDPASIQANAQCAIRHDLNVRSTELTVHSSIFSWPFWTCSLPLMKQLHAHVISNYLIRQAATAVTRPYLKQLYACV